MRMQLGNQMPNLLLSARGFWLLRIKMLLVLLPERAIWIAERVKITLLAESFHLGSGLRQSGMRLLTFCSSLFCCSLPGYVRRSAHAFLWSLCGCFPTPCAIEGLEFDSWSTKENADRRRYNEEQAGAACRKRNLKNVFKPFSDKTDRE